MISSLVKSVPIVTTVLFACVISWATPAIAQCDGGEGIPGGWSCPANCSGKNPSEHKSCTHGGTIRATAGCLNTSWKTVLGTSSAFSKPDSAQCGPAVLDQAPVCGPEAAGPVYWGPAGSNARFKHSTRPGFSTGGLGCGVGDWTDEFRELAALGCCAAGCQDPTGCQAISRVYTPSPSCTCAEPPNCSFCYSSLPCENGSEYDATCNCCYFPGSPIVFDLEVNRIAFSSPQEGYVFDIRANGRPVRVSWPISDQTYWLALDRNRNGKVDDGAELFGNATRLKGGGVADHGYIALAEFDDNHDGRIDAADAIYGKLVLWRHPLGTRSQTEPDEYRTLADAGVKWISLQFSESERRDRWGNWFRFRAPIRIRNSQTRWSYDVFLAEAPQVITTAGPACRGASGQNACSQ